MSITEIKPLNKTSSNQFNNNKLPNTPTWLERDRYGKRENNRKEDSAFALKVLNPTKGKFIYKAKDQPNKARWDWGHKKFDSNIN